VVFGVTRSAHRAGRPTVVLAGRVEVGRRELASLGVDAAYSADEVPFGDEPHTPDERLAVLAARVARTWSR
jgi:glycerate 2-kinase